MAASWRVSIHPSIAAISEGTAWNKGGSAGWQLLDVNGRVISPSGRAIGVPVWGLVGAYARANDFTLLYYRRTEPEGDPPVPYRADYCAGGFSISTFRDSDLVPFQLSRKIDSVAGVGPQVSIAVDPLLAR